MKRYYPSILIFLVLASCNWAPEPVEVKSKILLRPVNLALGDTIEFAIAGFNLDISDVSVTEVVAVSKLNASTLKLIGAALGKTRITIDYLLPVEENPTEDPNAIAYLNVTVTDGIPLNITVGEWSQLDLSEYYVFSDSLSVDSLGISVESGNTDEGLLTLTHSENPTEILVMGLSPGNHRLEIILFDSVGIQLAPLYFEVVTRIRKITLAELFTNAGCVNCPIANENLDHLYSQYPKVFSAIRYHVFWTDPNDPMNLYNPQEVEDRRIYYGGSWEAPRLFIDGSVEPAYENLETLSSRMNQSSELGADIHIWMPDYEESADSLFMSYRIQNFGSSKQNLVTWTVLTENSIEYSGTNGETIHMQVMRDMSATTLSILDAEQLIQHSLKLPPGYEASERYHLITFIQDVATSKVLQTSDYSCSELAGSMSEYP